MRSSALIERSAIRPPWSAPPEAVAAFVASHSTAYDPAHDTYPVDAPFAQSVKAGKNTPIYNAHAYHTKVPPLGIVPYLEHYTRPGDLVLDPFCGSGMTGVACLLTDRRAILNDLSPAATHIAYNYTTPLDAIALRLEWERLYAAMYDDLVTLYATRCDRCNGPAQIQYTVWSEVYGCATCGADLLLWDLAVVREERGNRLTPPLSAGAAPGAAWQPPTTTSMDRPAGSVLDTLICPRCRNSWRKTQLQRRRADPVLTVYDCAACRPARSEHPTTAAERELIERIAAEPILYWYPTAGFDNTREMWRGGHREAGITRVADFWTHRNLRALTLIWHYINSIPDSATRSALRFVFTASLPRSAVTTRYNFGKAGNAAVAGTLYIPSFSAENNIAQLFRRKFEDVFAGLSTLAPVQRGVISITGSATSLNSVPSASMDYIFTDPPFGSNIFYADCSLLWEAWLGYFTDERHEAVWNKSRKPDEGGKTLADYERLMAGAFQEMQRVLKPGRWASVVFHNSDDRVWNAIRTAATAAGFTLENATYLDKEQRSFKGVKGEKGQERVSNFDVVLNLRKPRPRPALRAPAPAAQEAGEVAETVVRIVQAHLRTLPSAADSAPGRTSAGEQRSTQFLHSLVIQQLANSGRDFTGYSYEAVEMALRRFYRQVDGRWYLPGEDVRAAAGPGGQLGLFGPEVRDEATAIEWLRTELARGPRLEGDLVGRFQVASARITLVKSLRQILDENFTYEPRRGRWRLPTPAEQATKMDVTRQAVRDRVQRWLAAPTGLDAATLADWLEDCYRRELYAEAHALFAHVPHDEPLPERYGQLRRWDRVCALKAAQSEPRRLFK
jgi:hypothetical protein